jgi:hypothetical protein
MGRAVILNEQMNTACGIMGASRNDPGGGLFAQKTMRSLPTQGRSATTWIVAAMLATTWASETKASSDQARYLADAQHAMAPRNFHFDGLAGYGGFEALHASTGKNDKSVQVAQAATSDAGQPREREHHWSETLFYELTIARRDIELLQRLEQERERSARLEQDLAAAQRDVEAQTALATKAAEDVLQRKQAAETGAGELRRSMQKERESADAPAQNRSMMRSAIYAYEAQARKAGDEVGELRRAIANGALSLCQSAQDEHDRSERLERHLAAAQRDVGTQTALAAKAGEEASRLKQASEGSEAELQKSLQQERERSAQLQQERERSGRLEQDLAAARRDVETQTALAAKAGEEGSRLKQASESSEAELQKSLQEERERSARLERDLAATRRDVETQTALATKAGEEGSRLKRVSESS